MVYDVIFRTEIDRQVQEIQAKRRKLNETVTEQEKVQKMICQTINFFFFLLVRDIYNMLCIFRLRLVQWVTMTI